MLMTDIEGVTAPSLFSQLSLRSLKKNFKYGTERICSVEDTWQRVKPLLPVFGITRVADITWLDNIGIPVYTAIRPLAKSISQSLGKGLTPMHARVSAVMESIEIWHAEELRAADRIATYQELVTAALIDYDPVQLLSPGVSFYCDTLPIEWLSCEDLTSGKITFLPRQFISMDSTLPQENITAFRASTNGLASGNSRLEATLHATCELIERDATEIYSRNARKGRKIVDINSINSVAFQQAIEPLIRLDAKVLIEDVTSDIRVPVIRVSVFLNDQLGIMDGYGCHPNGETALLRALTEAVQERANIIAATRDNIPQTPYFIYTRSFADRLFTPQKDRQDEIVDFNTVCSFHHDFFEQDLQTIIERISLVLDSPLLVVDLTNPIYQVPVISVVIPGLESKFKSTRRS